MKLQRVFHTLRGSFLDLPEGHLVVGKRPKPSLDFTLTPHLRLRGGVIRIIWNE